MSNSLHPQFPSATYRHKTPRPNITYRYKNKMLHCSKVLCILHTNPGFAHNQPKGNIMIYTNFEKQYKEAVAQFEELGERIKEVNEFWINSVLTSTKEFFKSVKAK